MNTFNQRNLNMQTYNVDWKTFKPLWIDALRSGKYEQGHLRLRTADDKYCCLGVVCDLVSKLPNIEGRFEWTPTSNFGTYFHDTINHKTNILLLPKSIRFDGLPKEYIQQYCDDENEYGIKVKVPYNLLFKDDMDTSLDTVTLVDLNDTYNFTFDQIADVIEKYLP